MSQEVYADFPPAFKPLFGPRRYKIYYGGRGGAKSWAFARAILMLGQSRKLRILCARELQNSIAESVHKLLSDQIGALGLAYTIEKARIYNAIGTEIFFEGIRQNIDKIKSYEGVDICWIEEGQRVTRGSFETLAPTIRRDAPFGPFGLGSEIWVSFNPDLETDYIYDRFVKRARPENNAVVIKVNHSDNPYFPSILREEMEELKVRDFDSYLHVWEGHCKTLLEGAVYADEMRGMVADGRLCRVPYSHEYAVETFWDLGWADSTAIWFVQRVGFNYHLIDYYENRLKGLDHYLDVCQGKSYLYDTFWLPHDAQAKDLRTGRSIQQLMMAKGKHVRVVPKLSLRDGINAARTIFSQCFFDEEKCAEGVKALRHYRYEIVEGSDGRLSKEPVHDAASHGADAFRYFALGSKQPRKRRDGRGHIIINAGEDQAKRITPYVEAIPRGLGWLR